MFGVTRRKGVTLIGLLVVVLLFAVLSFILVPQIIRSAQNAKQDECDTNVDMINSAIERYNADNGTYPASLTDIIGTEGAPTIYFPDGLPQCALGGTYIMGADYRTTCTHNLSRSSTKIF